MPPPTTDLELRPFEPGTTGWTADDLDDPEIDRLWQQGRYEIVEGVLATRPTYDLDASRAVMRLLWIVQRRLDGTELDGNFALGADYILANSRVAQCDVVFMKPDDEDQQRQAHKRRGKQKHLEFGRLLIPPTLIIESVSPGHERHDRVLKREWYAEAGVPNFWIFDAYAKSLECLRLNKRGEYERDALGKGNAEVRPSLFPGLVIPLKKVWSAP